MGGDAPWDEPLAALEHALSTRRDESRPFLLVVDQLEELFTHVKTPPPAAPFAKRLWALSGTSGVSCIVTLRVDFWGAAAR